MLDAKCNVGGWLYIGFAREQFYCFDKWQLKSGCDGVVRVKSTPIPEGKRSCMKMLCHLSAYSNATLLGFPEQESEGAV